MSCRCAKRNTIMMTVGKLGLGNPRSATQKRRAMAKLLRLQRGTSRAKSALRRVRAAQPAKSRAKRNCLPCLAAPVIGGAVAGAVGAMVKRNDRGVRSYLVPLAKVKKTPDVLEAIKRHTAFHGKPPTRFRVYEYPDGKSTTNEHVLFKLGAADITIDTIEGADGKTMKLPKKLNVGAVYRTDPSKSPNKKDGQYYHSFRESGGKPPIQAVDIKTGVLHTLGGTYSIGEWMER